MPPKTQKCHYHFKSRTFVAVTINVKNTIIVFCFEDKRIIRLFHIFIPLNSLCFLNALVVVISKSCPTIGEVCLNS